MWHNVFHQSLNSYNHGLSNNYFNKNFPICQNNKVTIPNLITLYDYNTNYDYTVIKPNNKQIRHIDLANAGIDYITENFGVVKSENGIISKIIESSCELDGDTVRCTPLNIDIPAFNVNGDNSVSMLMNGFTKEILDKIEADMTDAFKNNADHLDSFEMLLPDVMDDSIKEGKIILDVPTNSVWMGMTYQSDKQAVMDHIASEIEKGIYPSHLWNSIKHVI